jgi:hypothetical protein
MLQHKYGKVKIRISMPQLIFLDKYLLFISKENKLHNLFLFNGNFIDLIVKLKIHIKSHDHDQAN